MPAAIAINVLKAKIKRLEAEKAELLEARAWISVKDRLPAQEGLYIVCAALPSEITQQSVVFTAWFDPIVGWMRSSMYASCITHWMAIPPIPAGDAE